MLFFTDLDNTVLYSHRHVISNPMVWVEKLNGHNQSFMSERTYKYFVHQKWLRVIPVTTRTFQQYDRLIYALSRLGWSEALICNGAIRILNGVEDPEWTNESLRISEQSRIPFRKAYELAVELFGLSSIVLVEPFLFYVKTNHVDTAYSMLSGYAKNENLSFYKDSRKVYCIPKVFNKGCAIQRYKNRFKINACIVAGDSDFDVSMLQQADICFFPEGLSNFSAVGKKIICQDLFSDQICNELEKIRKEEISCD